MKVDMYTDIEIVKIVYTMIEQGYSNQAILDSFRGVVSIIRVGDVVREFNNLTN